MKERYMKRRKISHFIPRMPISSTGTVIGGSASSLYNLLGYQRESGSSPSLVTGRRDCDQDPSNLLQIPVTAMSIFSSPSSAPFGGELLARVLLRNYASHEADILHGHSGRAVYALATFLLARKSHRPWIHTLYCPVEGGSISSHLANRLASVALADASVVVGISDNVTKSARKLGLSRCKLRHIDPCIDTVKFSRRGARLSVRQDLEIPADAKVILFVGNSEKTKGLDLVLDAFASLAGPVKDLYMIATVELHGADSPASLNPYIRPQIRSRIRFKGVVDDMPALMEAADALILPFRSTNGPSDYPLAMLEAMSTGIPAIVASVGGVPEVIVHRENGLTFPPGDTKSLVNAIEELIFDAVGARRMAEAARETAIRRFSPQVVGEKWEALYEQVVGA